MGTCRNPECVRGLTPGLVVIGKGSAKVPVIGQTLRWGWVSCLACNAGEDAAKAGAKYKHVERTDEEMARRAELATSKAPYKESEVGNSLARVAKSANGAAIGRPVTAAPAVNSEQTAQISRLLATNEKLTNQVSELLEENRALRKQLDERPREIVRTVEKRPPRPRKPRAEPPPGAQPEPAAPEPAS